MPNIKLHGPEMEAAEAPAPQPAESPSQRIVKAGNAMSYATDAQGRTIGYRRLDAIEDFDLTEMAGAANAQNPEWLLRASIAMSVREIDGKPLPRIATKAQLRARIGLLGHEGMSAVLADIMPKAEDEASDDETEEGKEAEPPRSPMERAKN